MSRNIAESLLSKDQFEPAYEGNLIQTCEQLSRSDPGDSETALVRAQLPAIDGDAMADVFRSQMGGGRSAQSLQCGCDHPMQVRIRRLLSRACGIQKPQGGDRGTENPPCIERKTPCRFKIRLRQ